LQQGRVARRQLGHQGFEPGPELAACQPAAQRRFPQHEIVQQLFHLQAAGLDTRHNLLILVGRWPF
jgi:hypothetical protein